MTPLFRDPATDNAVLRSEADNLTEVALGNSEDLLVDDFVVAIGNPFGLGQTVTSGIVSALGHSGINPEGYEDFIQTDASINPSNSRGALIKLDGKLVGINTAIIAPNGGGNVGIGFAVPINMAPAVKDQPLEFGELQRWRLRVLIQDMTPDLAQALGAGTVTGGTVSPVEPGTPADDVGLGAGDVIVAVNGETVEGSPDLRQKIGLRRPGDRVKIGYIHDGEHLTAQVVLTRGAEQGPAARNRGDGDALGRVRFAPLDRSHPAWGEAQGVVVAEVLPGSRAARAGLEPGDVITAVHRQLAKTTRDIDRALEQAATTAIRPRPGPIAGSGPVNRWSSR
ncbi:MAG: PDZ domain-containing protein [Thioclava marina]|uniref:PDZ domain-containing protein n=1 Tax=Thioclava marina TaxID=1915077 RepID=UPI00199286B4|nr:PDZ domain-containing protein [Thioclava marina]MBC7146472.1 PDZ domain-containing protein [Thioclava marina]